MFSRAPVSLRRELLHPPGVLVLGAAIQRMPLDLALVTKGHLHSWVLEDCNIREFLASKHSPRHCTKSQLWKKTIRLSGASDWGEVFRFGNHLEAEVMQTGRYHLCTLPLPHSTSLVSPRKELMHSSKTPIFTTAAQRTTPDWLALVVSGAYTCSPTGL